MSDLIDTTEMYLRTVFELEEEGIPALRARIAARVAAEEQGGQRGRRHDAFHVVDDGVVACLGEEAARDYAGHSLRAGFCTQAALLNWPGHWIRQQSRHQSEATLARYIRPGLEGMPRRGVL